MPFPIQALRPLLSRPVPLGLSERLDQVYGELVREHQVGKNYHRTAAGAMGWQARLRGVAAELERRRTTDDQVLAQLLTDMSDAVVNPAVSSSVREAFVQGLENWMQERTPDWLSQR